MKRMSTRSPAVIVRGSIAVAITGISLGVSCAPAGPGTPPDVSATTAPSVTAAPPATAAPGAVTQQQIQGKWLVRSSSGQAGHGRAFVPLVGQTLSIEGDRLTYQDSAYDADGRRFEYPVTKIITLPTGTHPQAINLDQTPDMKGWRRVGIIALEGETMTLNVTFPQYARPTSMTPAEHGCEVVVLSLSPRSSRP